MYFASDRRRVPTYPGMLPGWCWLRSPADYQGYAAYMDINCDGNSDGTAVYHDNGGVRPAMWLDLGA